MFGPALGLCCGEAAPTPLRRWMLQGLVPYDAGNVSMRFVGENGFHMLNKWRLDGKSKVR